MRKYGEVLLYSVFALSITWTIIARLRAMRKSANEDEGRDIPNKKIPDAAGQVY
jgi:hypothetical protein